MEYYMSVYLWGDLVMPWMDQRLTGFSFGWIRSCCGIEDHLEDSPGQKPALTASESGRIFWTVKTCILSMPKSITV